MLIIAQASLYLGEDFQVIINEKWKYFNQCEVLSIVRTLYFSIAEMNTGTRATHFHQTTQILGRKGDGKKSIR